MAITPERLQQVVESLRSRPGHENVRGLVRELCVVGLDVPDREVRFEVAVPEVHGRIDALFGSTIFEFKRDLRIERQEAERGLSRYIADRERLGGAILALQRTEPSLLHMSWPMADWFASNKSLQVKAILANS